MATIASRPVSNLSSPASEVGVTDVLGVQISALTMDDAVRTIEGWVNTKQREYICICTVNTVMECRDDPGFMDVVNGAGLRTTDGMPLVWLSHRAGHKHVTRVYGPDLMLELCARSASTGHRHFFYGGGPGVVEELTGNLSKKFPGLNVVGQITPPMLKVGELESQETIDQINASGADIVWVGLNTPKQDWWVANHRHLLNAPVLIAVGAAFDFHSGRVRQAPKWMQRNGLEWFFRLTQDPKRLWRRYLVLNSRFIGNLALSKVRGGR
jgi:N-acetylglucosaminyldiphosphoundecaprenol N-acetyl-beta-D-mannosaminyltransferase